MAVSQGSLTAPENLSVATVMWGQLAPLKCNSNVVVQLRKHSACRSLTCSIRIAVTTGAAMLSRRWHASLSVREAILAVPPPTSGTESAALVSDVSLKTVVNGLIDEGVRQKEIRIFEMTACQTR
jgi:hypothetical protein